MAAYQKLSLQTSNNPSVSVTAPPEYEAADSGKIYRKKTRTARTYIGSIEKHRWTGCSFEIGDRDLLPVFRVPGLYKFFDEILVNPAADNKQREHSTDFVEVVIDAERRFIVCNNGNDVPMEMQEEGACDLEKYEQAQQKYCILKDEQHDKAIELCFSEKKNAVRMMTRPKNLEQKKLNKYCDFVLTLFSLEDLQQYIPSMMDGLKPDQRKVLFSSFKLDFVTMQRVCDFACDVVVHSHYHGGWESAAKPIISMAQNFVGSNNINLLEPIGQFGSRFMGGEESASSLHTYTRLSPVTRSLFPNDDDILLAYLKDDGESVEPIFYMPVIPTVLVNGSGLVKRIKGFEPRWSTFIPNYHPREIVANIERLILDEPMIPMNPWYKGFNGSIQKSTTKEGRVIYTTSGRIDVVDATTVRITELPTGVWSQEYCQFLNSMIIDDDGEDESNGAFIEDFSDYCGANSVLIEVILPEEKLVTAMKEGLLEKFRLTKTFSTSDMYLLDSKGMIKKYETPEQILEEFYHERLKLYAERKKVLLGILRSESQKLVEKLNFTSKVLNGKISLRKAKQTDLFEELVHDGFVTPFSKNIKDAEAVVAGVVGSESVRVVKREELIVKIEQLREEKKELDDKADYLSKETPETLWLKDLRALLRLLDACIPKEQNELDNQEEAARQARLNRFIDEEYG